MRRVLLVLALLAAALVLAPNADAADGRRALLIGINDYAGRTDDTVTAVGDVIDLRDLLLREGWAPENVRVLTDGAATAQAIRDGLRWLGDTSTDASLSVFHWSGHVKQLGGDRDRDGEELDEYLWSHDNVFLADLELRQWIDRVRGRTWVDIAGCEASGFDDGISGPNRLFTASSLEHEKSYEQPAWNNSVFTGLLVDQGMLQGRADLNGDGAVSIQEAFFVAADQAPHITSRQSHGPQHPLAAGGGEQQWYLGAGPAPTPPAAQETPAERRCLVIFTCS
ncbi:MAG TPA: caspase family protein [Acidimicrobiales bacterium]|nr:caspase family protein [Acidimicrobiales bacterium]